VSLGDSLAAQGKYPQAEDEYKVAAMLNPRNSTAQQRLDKPQKKKD
jgi:hypothetical protein